MLAVGPGGAVAGVPPALLGVDGEAVAGRGAVLVGQTVTLEEKEGFRKRTTYLITLCNWLILPSFLESRRDLNCFVGRLH